MLIRPREDADVPVLAAVLAEQQPSTRYPLRWPLPFPIEQFLVRPSEERAWVAEQDGRVVGHVAAAGVEPERAAAFTAATGREGLGAVTVLFVAGAVRGTGVGGRLLDTAVSWIEEQDRLPVLDVVPRHAPAVDVYRHRGWTEVARIRPPWLPDEEDDVLLMALLR